jgi:uncharacterized protein
MNRPENTQTYRPLYYFLLCFGISWTGGLLVLLPTLLRHEPFQKMVGLLMFPVLLIGPPSAGLGLTLLYSGRKGIRALGQRMRRWQVERGFYLTAFCIPPLLIPGVLYLLSQIVSPVFKPNFFPAGIIFGVFAGFLEEIGWTGFAYPSLRKNFSAPCAAIILGIIWGLWHLPVIDFLGAGFPHGRYLPLFILDFCTIMTGIRCLICWIYERTGSLLYAQAMHAVSTGSLVMFGPATVSPGEETLWYGCYGILLLTTIVSGFWIFRKRISKQPSPKPSV